MCSQYRDSDIGLSVCEGETQMKPLKATRKADRESISLPQATRRFAKQVKITIAALTLLLIAALAGATIKGDAIRENLMQWVGNARWSWIATTPYAQYAFDTWTPCTRPLGETGQLTLVQLADNIQHKAEQIYLTDSFYVAVYDEDWNLAASSDNYEMHLYSKGCDGTFNPWCQYSDTRDQTQAPAPAAKMGHSHTVLIDEPVAYDFSARTERDRLPGWFTWMAERAGTPAYIAKAVSPESAREALMEECGSIAEIKEVGGYTTSDGTFWEWGSFDLMWRIFTLKVADTEKHPLVTNFVSYEKIYLRPIEIASAPENLTILAEKYAVADNPAFTQFYEHIGDLYDPVLKDEDGWYQSQPGDEEEIFFVCTAGVYSPIYAAIQETIRNYSAAYFMLLMGYILLMIICIFIEYRLFSVVQQRTIQSQRDLLVTVAHELKTPMGVVLLYGEKVEHGTEISAMQQDAKALHGEIKQMNSRLMDVLTVSRLDNMSGIPSEPLALDELLMDTCDEFLPLIEEKAISLQTELAPDTTVPANAFYIRAALHNFLSNAVKFTPRGGRIVVRLEQGRKSARIRVFNSGSHIDEKEAKKIWGSFYKISDDGDNKGRGTGLGLSIVQSIVRLHEGHCGFNNQADGVEFWFEVPMNQRRKGMMRKGVRLRKGHGTEKRD